MRNSRAVEVPAPSPTKSPSDFRYHCNCSQPSERRTASQQSKTPAGVISCLLPVILFEARPRPLPPLLIAAHRLGEPHEEIVDHILRFAPLPQHCSQGPQRPWGVLPVHRTECGGVPAIAPG